MTSIAKEKMGKANPFAVPNNNYKDTWLDLMWIGLFCRRISEALSVSETNEEEPGNGLGEEPTTQPSLCEVALVSQPTIDGKGLKKEHMHKRGAVSKDNTQLPNASSEGSNNRRWVGFGRSGKAQAAAVAGVDVGEEIVKRPTYDDYVDLAIQLQKGPPEHQREVVRGVLRSIFPAWFPSFYRLLFPVGKFSSEVNAFMCPPLFTWLVGKSKLVEGEVEVKVR
ncbi:unnamed protein product [Choristocarpus tenellus]